VNRPGTLAWFARHEFRLAWRDWLAMMTAGGRARTRTVAIALVIFAVVMHLIAYAMVSRYAGLAAHPDKTALAVITGSALLSLSLMLSQAMESVTRAFFARSDLDLLLSSPAPAQKIFAVRIATIALSVIAMAALLAAPFINVLAFTDGARWLMAYGAVAALGAAAAAVAVSVTTVLFHLIGPRRTRLFAQIVAAVIGAAFVIGLQLAAIASEGTMSRYAALASEPILALAPDADSLLWWPARAMLGDGFALAVLAATSLAMLGAAIVLVAPRFADCAIAAAGTTTSREGRRAAGFRRASPMKMLHRKEWALLRRDPWLMSQTLMQMLYLLPPAFLLWKSFEDSRTSVVLLVPVLVMAAGQLAGGLAWLAISGEDAPDLIATAPLTARQVTRAKIEAVIGCIALVFAPFLLALALLDAYAALVAALGIAAAAAAATAIQLYFRAQAKRSQFRRRQTSSRVATFAEAFSSISWAGAAALAAAGTAIAVVPAIVAVAVLFGVRMVRPKTSDAAVA
jgi:ABC-2 type transport system permease protein